MPGFIIHLTEAAMIMDYMKMKPDSDWKQEFLLGNLLPDPRLGAERPYPISGLPRVEKILPGRRSYLVFWKSMDTGWMSR